MPNPLHNCFKAVSSSSIREKWNCVDNEKEWKPFSWYYKRALEVFEHSKQLATLNGRDSAFYDEWIERCKEKNETRETTSSAAAPPLAPKVATGATGQPPNIGLYKCTPDHKIEAASESTMATTLDASGRKNSPPNYNTTEEANKRSKVSPEAKTPRSQKRIHSRLRRGRKNGIYRGLLTPRLGNYFSAMSRRISETT